LKNVTGEEDKVTDKENAKSEETEKSLAVGAMAVPDKVGGTCG
jgi:hypothetical protein